MGNGCNFEDHDPRSFHQPENQVSSVPGVDSHFLCIEDTRFVLHACVLKLIFAQHKLSFL